MTVLPSSTAQANPTPLKVRPGPPQRWPGGHLIDFNRDPLAFLTHCARDYGDVVELRFGPFPIFLINRPELIEAVLVTHNRQFQKGRGLEQTRNLLGNGLLTSEGDFWRRQRRLAQPAFHHQRIAGYAETMRRRTRQMLAGWQDGESLDAHQAMMDLTMAIAAETLFSADVTGQAHTVSRSMDALLKIFSRRNRRFFIPEWVPTPDKWRRERAIQALDSVVYGLIAERRAAGQTDGTAEHSDLLDMLLQARDESGAGMSDRQLRDEVMTLFLAGHETTANALSWSWMLLGQHPEVEAKLHAEIEGVLGEREPRAEDLPRLPYAAQVINESMRLYPPAWVIGRQAIDAVDLDGVRLPAEAGVLMSQWVMHRDPRYYENPEAFIPERWEGDLQRRNPAFSYFPFGGGPRLCIGRPFALMEAALVLVMVAQRYRLELVPGQHIVPRPSITLRPGGGVQVRLRRRG